MLAQQSITVSSGKFELWVILGYKWQALQVKGTLGKLCSLIWKTSMSKTRTILCFSYSNFLNFFLSLQSFNTSAPAVDGVPPHFDRFRRGPQNVCGWEPLNKSNKPIHWIKASYIETLLQSFIFLKSWQGIGFSRDKVKITMLHRKFLVVPKDLNIWNHGRMCRSSKTLTSRTNITWTQKYLLSSLVFNIEEDNLLSALQRSFSILTTTRKCILWQQDATW